MVRFLLAVFICLLTSAPAPAEVLDSSEGGFTVLTATYVVGGYAAAGLAPLAGPVDGVVAGQMQGLAGHLAP